MKYKVKHFDLQEFACVDCKQAIVADMLVFWIDQIRSACGIPIKINSGYRCVKHNAEVGGTPYSRHLIGCAADVTLNLRKLEFNDFHALCNRFQVDGGELIAHPQQGYVHFAVPRDEARRVWLGGLITI